MILDTSFLIELYRRAPAAFEKGQDLQAAGVVQRVPTPVVMELEHGVQLYGDSDEQYQVRNVTRMYPIVRLSEGLARRAGELLAQADAAAGGESGIDKVDPMVAAVADTLDEPVLTDNVRHFEALGVPVETF